MESSNASFQPLSSPQQAPDASMDATITNVLESMNDPFYALDSEWRFVYLNRRAEELLQRSRAELLGRNIWLEFPEAVNSRVYRAYHESVASGDSVRLDEYYGPLEIHVEVNAQPSPEGIAVYFRNVTEARQTSEQLRENERRFEAVWEFAGDGMVLSDREGIVIEANPAYCALYGYTREEVVGHSFAIIFPEGMREWAIDLYRQTFADEEIAPSVQSTIRRKDGSTRMVEVRYTFIVEDGERTAMLSLVRDVTANKLAHAELEGERTRLATIIEATTEGIYGMDADARCTFINSAALDFLGYSAEECVGKNMHDLVHYKRLDGSPYPAEECPIVSAFSNGRPQRLIEETLWHKEGRPLPALYSCSPILEDGRAVGSVVTIIDNSERRRAEEERLQILQREREARVVAERAVRAHEQLLSVVSHDMRNPIAVINGVTQLLQRRLAHGKMPDAAKLGEELARIVAASSRIDVFIRDLLDSEQLQAGEPLSLNREQTDLVALARRVAAGHLRNTGRHELLVGAEMPELVGLWDPARLEQVMDNLLSNAIKYSPEGGAIRVSISCEGEAGEGAQAVLSVEDEGIGIPESDVPRVFEWYHRGANVEGRISGTGIGLAGARHIVEQHGGTITAQSVEGRGSTFTIRLPVADGKPARS